MTVKTYTEEVGSKLNILLEKNYDAEKGYTTASSNAENVVLKKFFERKAAERKQFADQLKSEISSLNQTPETTGSIAGTVHRAWMNTKIMFSTETDEILLEEAIRGEKASIDDYDDVLKSELYLPEAIQSILTTQRNTIVNNTLTIQKLEDIQ